MKKEFYIVMDGNNNFLNGNFMKDNNDNICEAIRFNSRQSVESYFEGLRQERGFRIVKVNCNLEELTENIIEKESNTLLLEMDKVDIKALYDFAEVFDDEDMSKMIGNHMEEEQVHKLNSVLDKIYYNRDLEESLLEGEEITCVLNVEKK